MAASTIEKSELAVIQSLIMKFIWRGRPPKVAKATLRMKAERGGLKVKDLEIMNKATRVAWIGRMIRLQEGTFVKVLEDRIRADLKDIVQVNYDITRMSSRFIPEYYKQMFEWFTKTGIMKVPDSGEKIRRQLVWQNSYIRVQGKSLFNKTLSDRGIRMIDDFVDDVGNILSFDAFSERHGFVRINRLVYLGWCQAIPAKWRTTVRNSPPLTILERESDPKVNVKGKIVPLVLVKTSYFSDLFTPEVVPTAQIRWERENVNFRDDWRRVYLLPFRITTSTRLQSLHFKIIHRFFPTRKYLCTRNVIEDPFCNNCGEIEHCFFECADIADFWVNLERRLNAKMPA